MNADKTFKQIKADLSAYIPTKGKQVIEIFKEETGISGKLSIDAADVSVSGTGTARYVTITSDKDGTLKLIKNFFEGLNRRQDKFSADSRLPK
jgi:hypothetical protein